LSRIQSEALVLEHKIWDRGIIKSQEALDIGLQRSNGIEGACELYHKMVGRNFVPMGMLMKIFYKDHELDLGLTSLVEESSCPHGHALIPW